MAKSRATFFYIVVICFTRGFCNAGSIEDLNDGFGSLINSANSTGNTIEVLHSQANKILYNKFHEYIDTGLSKAMLSHLTQIRTLISNSTSPNTHDCYTHAHQKIRQIATDSFLELRPCYDTGVAIIKGYIWDITQSLEFARHLAQNLREHQKLCLEEEQLEFCESHVYPNARRAVTYLKKNVLPGFSDIVEVCKKAVEDGTAECLKESFNNTHAKTLLVVDQLEECLRT